MKPTRLVVGHKEKSMTLQDFLSARLDVSRNRAKRLLDGRGVLVNRRRVWMARHALRAGDVVEAHAAPSAPQAIAPRLLHEDADFLVADKPPGVESTGPRGLEGLLRERRDEPSLAAAHRLDTDTSGCMLFARNAHALAAAVEAFRAGRVEKTYHAIVSGRLVTAGRTLAEPLDGQRAVTHIRTLAAGPRASHLVVRIDTGRTHQIRRHLALLGHPILGDSHYAAGKREADSSIEAPRQMLHAAAIGVATDAEGRTLFAASPLPKDFVRCLARHGLLRDVSPGGGR
jgi:23S rRNA pseudouridine1911/1915/1917 synthase